MTNTSENKPTFLPVFTSSPLTIGVYLELSVLQLEDKIAGRVKSRIKTLGALPDSARKRRNEDSSHSHRAEFLLSRDPAKRSLCLPLREAFLRGFRCGE
jgi:hypothetical protein